MTDCSNCSKVGGNTKTPTETINPAVKWCFTFNNYTEQDFDEFVPKVEYLCKRYIISHEVGELNNTPHLQGYVEFKKKRRPKNLFNEKIHWEKAKGSAMDNYLYCEKEGNVRVKHGWPPEYACRKPEVLQETQLRVWQKKIIEDIREKPDDRTIYWYWSKNGNLGKTTFTKYLVIRHEATILAGKGADVRNGVVEFVKQKGFTPHLVVYPIPRSFNNEYLSYESIENIKDMLFYSGKFEGGMVCGNCPHVVVFANEPPDCSRMSVDRWKIFEILDDHTFKAWTPIIRKKDREIDTRIIWSSDEDA